MLTHKQTTKEFLTNKYLRTQTYENEEKLIDLFQYPQIDHEICYFQTPQDSKKTIRRKNLFLVSYSYCDTEKLKEWKIEVEKFGYRIYLRNCFYGSLDSYLILIAGPDVNFEEAIKFIHENPSPNRKVEFK